MLRRLFLVLLVSGVVAAGLAGRLLWLSLHAPLELPSAGVTISIPPGTPLQSVVAKLSRAGVVRYPKVLVVWARYHRMDRSVRSGEHHFSGSVSGMKVLEQLRSSAFSVRWVTVPEGMTAEQTAIILEEAGFGGRDVILGRMRDPSLLQRLLLPATGVEGYLFPDTYAFEWAMEPETIVAAMVQRFRQESAALAEARVRAGLSELEMVILASVIEKETGRAAERRLVAGVFHNRLRISMPLQSDPTVLYGRPAEITGPLTRADLQYPSPYNTYQRLGLPPGPIANPGAAALAAAVSPGETKALYFVARGDGTHEFSASLAEHNRAVRRYREFLRKKKSRGPKP